MSRPRRLPTLLLLAALALLARPVLGDEPGVEAPGTPEVLEGVPPEPDVVVHVPSSEMDLLLAMDERGVVLRHDAYRRLLAAARARATSAGARPPRDGALRRAEGEVDASDDEVADIAVTYDVEVLAEGVAYVPFPVAGLAVTRLEVVGEGTYEEAHGHGRLRFEGPGVRQVVLRGHARIPRREEQRQLQLRLPPAAAMDLVLRVPPGMRGHVVTAGVPTPWESAAEAGLAMPLVPGPGGAAQAAWAPAAPGSEGPPVLDVRSRTLHRIEDGLIRSRVLLQVDVMRVPIEGLRLRLPPAMTFRAVEGDGVVETARSEDRQTLRLKLARPHRGTLTLTLDAETPYEPGGRLALPRVLVEDAARQQGEAALRFERGIEARAITIEGGRRLPTLAVENQTGEAERVLRYALADAAASLAVDVEPTEVELEASSTYYLNLAEPAKTLIAGITYNVRQGKAYALRPRFPAGFLLRSLVVNGAETGFRSDPRPDGRVDVRLERGVEAGGTIELLATLEDAEADWVPERGGVAVAFPVPSTGADREDGYLGVGADAAFRVLDVRVEDLRPVGAADLTARGIRPEGLVYGYRLDGTAPALTLEVERRRPRVEADVVTRLRPAPRRLEVLGIVVHRVERAGVRTFHVDVPTWARDVVRIEAPDLRSHHRIDEPPENGVPPGYDRWRVELAERVLGRHAIAVRYHQDLEDEDWSVPADRPLALHVGLDRVERIVVVERADGLEVDVTTDAVAVDPGEIPAEAAVDPMAVLEVLRLEDGRTGPGIAVTRHDGAGVLEALATRVALHSALAPEGIVRTRAEVALVNVGLQFLPVRLPHGSRLEGAIVDDAPVKPLVDADGTLRIPIPPARAADRETVAALTYTTPLGEPARGRVALQAPVFPGLEVLQTTHEVAVDPAWRVHAVGGDYGATKAVRPPAFRPPLLAFLGRIASPLRLTARVQYETAPAGSAVRSDDGYAHGEASRPTGGEAHGREVPQTRAPADPAANRAPEPTTALPQPARAPQAPPEKDEEDADGDGEGDRGGGGPPVAGGEGPGAPPGPPSRGARRKGLLSLDIPVLLSPRRVRASRLGGGGTLTLELVSETGRRTRYQLLLLGAVALGLVLGLRRRALAFGVVAGAALLAWLVHGLWGREGAVATAALADAAVLLALLLALRALLRLLLRVPRRPAAAAAALLLLGLLAGAATPAHADGEDGDTTAEDARTLYVPYDPEDPEALDAHDRVFLPFETWMRLRRAAHPDEDPALLASGRVTVLRRASHALVIEDDVARGTSTYGLEKRGEALDLLPLPLGALPVTAARLDGEPVRLIPRDDGLVLPVLEPGEHVLEIDFELPVDRRAGLRLVRVALVPFVGATMQVHAPGFRGVVEATGPGRVVVLDEGQGTRARLDLGAVAALGIVLRDPEAREPTVTLRTRAESRTVHSIRRGGTASRVDTTVHVLQGEMATIDVAVPEDVRVLEAGGAGVLRWSTEPGRVRLHLAGPRRGIVRCFVRTWRPAATPAREERLPSLALEGTTGERGQVVLNADPTLRVDVRAAEGLLRQATPSDEAARGEDGDGRVVGGWGFATRPTSVTVAVEALEETLDVTYTSAVAFGGDRVRSRLEAEVALVGRAPVGDLVFSLPGDDEVRHVTSPGLDRWWIEGEDDARRLHLRYADLRTGRIALRVDLERRLGGRRDAVAVPRLGLAAARAIRGRLVLHALPDVELAPGGVPGLRPVPRSEGAGVEPPVDGARAVLVYRWETPLASSLLVTLEEPVPEIEAVVVTSVAPSDELLRVDHLVLYEVRRGRTDEVALFVPDGGFADHDIVRAQDLREVRRERAMRRDEADGTQVEGTLYRVRFQGPRTGLVEITVSQLHEATAPLRVVQPEGVSAVRWFTAVRTFLDGEVDVAARAGAPDPATFDDFPFLPTGLERSDLVRAYTARAPYVLAVDARRHRLQDQAAAVVRALVADVVVGRDGQARMRCDLRLFNRSRQLLPLELPPGAVLYGVTAAGRAVKPLRSSTGALLVPIPKVPAGAPGYAVSLLFRVPAGGALPDGDLEILLPRLLGVEVDRTVVRLHVPEDLAYDLDTSMIASDASEVAADLAEATVREANDLLEVAASGTLEQRRRAVGNAAVLVAQAKALTERAGSKARGLGAAVAQAEQEWNFACRAVVDDLRAAGRGDEMSQALAMSSNAYSAVQTEAEQPGGTDAGEAAQGQQGTWRFNDAEVEDKVEIQDLKRRYGEALEERERAGQRDRAQTAAGLEATVAEAQQAEQRVAGVNRVLAEEWSRNFQYGAAVRSSAEAEARRGFEAQWKTILGDVVETPNEALAGLDDVTNGAFDITLGSPSAGYRIPFERFPSAPSGGVRGDTGIFFNDGRDGTVMGRVENLFDEALGEDMDPANFVPPDTVATDNDLPFQEGFGAPVLADAPFEGPARGGRIGLGGGAGGGGGGTVAPRRREGLLGVDARLPRMGRVYHFRSLKTGAPIQVSASTPGLGGFLRWAILLLVLAGLGVLATRAWRTAPPRA